MSGDIGIKRARAKYEQARKTRVLHLGNRFLRLIPQDVWSLGASLLRLDLGCNNLTRLPAEVASLSALEQLWLNDNPGLVELCPDLDKCKKLRELDVRRTALATLPKELGRLKHLLEILLEDTPFQQQVLRGDQGGAKRGRVLDTEELVAELERQDRRESLKQNLQDKISGGIYREEADSPEGQELIPALVEAVSIEFSDLDELRNVVRNCDRLFPAELSAARNARRAARRLKEKFVTLRRENERKKLSTELELKLRAIYYDVIEPTEVEGVIRAVYEGDWTVEKPLELEDLQFLIKNAPRLFPEKPGDITGPGVRKAVWDLQDQLIRDRNEVVDKLFQALSHSLYSDREPALVRELAVNVGKLFERDRFATKKELEEMKKLAADAAQHFPPEFNTAQENPSAVRASFKRAEAAAAASMML